MPFRSTLAVAARPITIPEQISPRECCPFILRFKHKITYV